MLQSGIMDDAGTQNDMPEYDFTNAVVGKYAHRFRPAFLDSAPVLPVNWVDADAGERAEQRGEPTTEQVARDQSEEERDEQFVHRLTAVAQDQHLQKPRDKEREPRALHSSGVRNRVADRVQGPPHEVGSHHD